MKKSTIIILTIIIFIIIGITIYFVIDKNNMSNNQQNYQANKTSTNSKEENKEKNEEEIKIQKDETNIIEEKVPTVIEEELATFTTKIYSQDTARQNNVKITCETLNETIVKKEETFSFCGVVGQSTTSKGYQKADIFDKDGNKTKGLGGGNCQVSTTLYNALLIVPTLIITERHPHSSYVPYVPKGKDAAVAYGSYDLKFRNDSGNDIKILCSTDGSSITTTIITLK